MKHHCTNQSVSNEDFVNDLFLPYVRAGRINGRSGEGLYLDKYRVSNLLTQKDNVPKVMREALNRYNIKEATREDFYVFLDDDIVSSELSILADEIQCEIVRSDNISSERKSQLQSMIKDPKAYLLETFFDAIRLNNKVAEQERTLWKNGLNSLKLVVGDLFQFALPTIDEKKKLIVIPVNTAFDTKISYESDVSERVIVSPNSIHGKWLINCLQNGFSIEFIQSCITECLDKFGHPRDIGTIVTVPIGEITYVLLAISRFDGHSVAHSTEADLHKALLSLMNYYNEHGNGYGLYFPLMGTGFSRTQLGYAESYKFIKSVMLDNKELIQGKATLVVTAEAMKEIAKAISEEEK